MKFAVVTFGCRVNQADSLGIEDQLIARGGTRAEPADADLLIVNTCSVTSAADQGARQTVRRVVRGNPGVKVVMTGCYATRRPDEAAALPNVLHVIPNGRKDALIGELEAMPWWTTAWTTAQRYAGGDGPCGLSLRPGDAGRTAFTIRVQTGCDQTCSYCIIPRTRGQGRSRPLPDVIADISRAVAAGYKEMAITGVHLGSYGRDLGDGTTLERLVRVLAEWPDDVLFRISSLEPMDCTPAIVRLAAGSPRLAPHFHLPLQHACDAMLAAMRRPYTAAFYRDLVGEIQRQMPHASVGTDLIAGFPGESPDAATRTEAFVSGLPLSHVHVFPYSDRPGTDASALGNKAEGADIRERARVLREAGARLTRAFHARQIGTRRRALTVDDGTHAVTDNYLKLRLEERRPRNEWVDVTVCGSPGALEGRL